ncbi:MAG: hypothetical protein K8T20_15870 [Planctomycetes bacterium]|nr:hypothetical protein [Planctomycetota bacterium]
MKLTLRIALLLALAHVAAAQAIGPVAEPGGGPEPERVFRIEHGWHGFEKGAWVEWRVMRREGDKRNQYIERRELRSIAKDGTAVLAMTLLSNPSEPWVQSVEDFCLPEADLKYEGFEQPEKGGVQQRCTVLSATDSAGAKYRFSVGTYVPTPASLVASDCRRRDGSSLSREAVEFNRFVEIGGRRVMGTAFREVEMLKDDMGMTVTEEIESPDMPGGVVSRKGKGWIIRHGTRLDVETEESVTAFGDDDSIPEDKVRRACDDVRALFRYLPSAWKGFGAGSSVLSRCETSDAGGKSSQVSKTTLKAVKSGGWTMEYETLEQWHKAGETPVGTKASVQDMPWNSCYLRWARVKPIGTETVKACGKDWPCDIFSVVIPSPANGNAAPLQDLILEYRVWRCTTFPANDGIIRRDFGWGHRGKETVMTETQTVIDLDRQYRIGATDYPCFVLKVVHDDDKDESLTETDRWICPAVPGGEVRQERWKVAGGKRESTMVLEVLEVEAKKP